MRVGHMNRTIMKFGDIVTFLHFHRTCAIFVLLTSGQVAHGFTAPNPKIFIIEEELDEDITCWTCPNKSDNLACNNWAPDIHCPFNHTVCKTVHHIQILNMESVRVHKMCALQHQCTEDMIGCFETDSPDIMECVSCCSTSYCNEVAPLNHTMAIILSSLRKPPTSSARENQPCVTMCLLLPLLMLLCFLSTATECVIDPSEKLMMKPMCSPCRTVISRISNAPPHLRKTRLTLDRRRN